MASQIGLLRDNFQEIYCAIHTSNQISLPLVANYSGTRIYVSTQGWGRLWTWFYHFTSWLIGNDSRSDKLQRAMIHTHVVFQKQVALVNVHLNEYQKYLEQAGKGYAVKESKVSNARHAITNWNAAIGPFIKMLQTLPDPIMQKLLLQCFEKIFLKEEITNLFFPLTLKALFTCQKIINLEGITQGPLPLFTIKKILKGKEIDTLDQKTMDKWIKKINKSSVSASKLHQAIMGICMHYEKSFNLETAVSKLNKGVKKLDPLLLEIFLEDKGCTAFQKSDPKHIQWQQCLEKGSKIMYSDPKEELILGYEVRSNVLKADNTHVFQIENNDKLVAIIAQNKVVLPIKQRRQMEIGFGISPASFLSISPDGKFALMEHLNPISSYKWISTNECIVPEDFPILNALANLLKELVKRNQGLSNFSPNFVMFDKEHHLKAIKPMLKQPFNFNHLENFAWESAAGNLTIFKFLMTTSGLAAHSASKFYYEIIKSALKGDMVSVPDLAGIYKIGDYQIVERADKLAKDVLLLRQELFSTIQKLIPSLNAHLLDTKITEAILSCHKVTCAAGFLCPSLAADVIEENKQWLVDHNL